jgi:UDPglucose--hexose-1-phosphate uridylyltransferase
MELRKDYVLDRWVIISQGRSKRPKQFKEKGMVTKKVDIFAFGNEKMTPKEIGRVCDGKKWKIRWFANKFPAVDSKGESLIKTDNKYFTFSSAYGVHEVIVETRLASKQLSDLPASHIKQVLQVYANRILDLSAKKGVAYVSVFKNHGAKGGTSIVHSHSQVIAYNKVPAVVLEEAEACRNGCPYCEILEVEKKSHRRCFENKNFVAFTPYASRFNYEIWVFPKEHLTNITQFSNQQFMDMASILKKILVKLKKLGVDYNFFLHYAPSGKDLHFHIEVCPRIATWGGFELATEATINSVSPEAAAKFYRK